MFFQQYIPVKIFIFGIDCMKKITGQTIHRKAKQCLVRFADDGHMKHLDLCYYWLRDQVAINKIQPLYLKTEDMPADLLTKPFAKPQVEKLRAEMGLVILFYQGVVLEL
jgi:hypothetical protein